MGLWTRTTTSLLRLFLPNPKGLGIFEMKSWKLPIGGGRGGERGIRPLAKTNSIAQRSEESRDNQRTLCLLQSMLRQEELRQQERDAQ